MEYYSVIKKNEMPSREYAILKEASFAIIREIGVKSGGSNIQFAICPRTGRQVIIEMNPRVSRSSALASKATGFPIAKFSAKLAFCRDSLKVVPMLITSPTLFMAVVKRSSAFLNFSKVKRGTLHTT